MFFFQLFFAEATLGMYFAAIGSTTLGLSINKLKRSVEQIALFYSVADS